VEPCYVEKWLHDKVRQLSVDEPEFATIVGSRNPPRVGRADIESFQLFKLKRMLRYVYQKDKFYGELFRRSEITPEDVRCLDDLVKLPFTEPASLREAPHKFYCISLAEISREYVFDSSGTTGLPKKVACTKQDIERMVDFMSAGMRTVSASGDVILILLPNGRPNSQADLLSKGVRLMGGVPVIGNLGASPTEQVEAIERYHPQLIFTSPSRIHRITMGYQPRHRLKKTGVKTLFFTSEHLSQALKNKLQDIWDCDVHAHYGMTEMGLGISVECHAHDGFHFNEADLLLEIINPNTGKAIGDETEGELVFTTLSREGTPLIRYRTHDISRLLRHPCPCGAVTLKRIGSLVKKRESIVTIGNGDEIHPSFFDDVLYSLFEVVDYQLAISKQAHKDCLKFTVEVSEEKSDLGNELKRRLLGAEVIEKNLLLGKLVEPEIELVGPGTLQRRTRAKKLIIDNRGT